jgi:hypothetical protein
MSESETKETSLEEEKEQIKRELLECLEMTDKVAAHMSKLVSTEDMKRRQFETNFSKLHEVLVSALEVATLKKVAEKLDPYLYSMALDLDKRLNMLQKVATEVHNFDTVKAKIEQFYSHLKTTEK